MLQTPAYALKETIANAMAQSGLFVSLATFYKRPGDPSEEVDQYGGVILSEGFSVVAGLENISCMFAPLNVGTPNVGDTTRTVEQYDSKTEFHLLLEGFFPAVQQRYLVRVDGSQMYEVMGVESDSQSTQTRCAVRAYGL